MELGKARLRKVGINNLHCAVHPQHGVIWTDGRAIYLAPLHVDGKQVQNATSVRLGQFENVTSVHWSCSLEGQAACYLCVVHQHNVTVWRVSGMLPKLTFKQTRKINVRPIAQGCLWNPINDTLALLSRHQCSFYFQHDGSKGSYALPPLESGKISCGCWSTDGKKLIVSIGAALLVYRWSDLNASVSDFVVTAWRVPSLEGEITSISPMPKNCLVVATELPLESLCRKQDAFIVPDNGRESNKGDGVIRPSNQSSVTDKLMNLQPNAQMMKENSSILTLIKFHEEAKEPTKISSAPLKGVLTPDILLYEKSSQCVVVGSNSQSQLHIYALLDKHLAYCGDIQLDKAQRPKGLCSMPTYFDERGAALLILVGQREAGDESFPSSSVEAEFQVSLKYIIIKPGFEGKPRQRNVNGDSLKSKSMANLQGSQLNKSESMREQRLAALSINAQARGRSGSAINDDRTSSPLLTTTERGSPHLISSQSATTENSLPQESQQVRITTSNLEEPTLSIFNSTTSSQRTSAIQDMSGQSSIGPEDLEVEGTSFSSQSPQFNNNKLTQKYELTAKDGLGVNAHVAAIGNSNETRGTSSTGGDTRSGGNLSNPHPVLVKSPSDQIDEMRGHRTSYHDHAALVKSSSDEITRNNADCSTVNSGNSPHHERSSLKDKGRQQAGKENNGHFYESQGSHHANLQEKQVEGMSEAINGQINGRTDLQEGTTQGQGQREETTSDLGSSRHSADSSFDSMEKQVKSQRSNIEALQRRLEDLTSTVEECCCVFPAKYQDMQSPELIEIQCIKSDGAHSKKFLLDNGRLQLDPVRLAFNLATVELWLDGVPVVLSANIDGYIPMKFSPASVLRVSGQPASASTQ